MLKYWVGFKINALIFYRPTPTGNTPRKKINMTTMTTTTNTVEKTNHRVTKLIWNVNGKISTFNTARDDDRKISELQKRYAEGNYQPGSVYWMIQNYPNNFVKVNVVENLPKDVAESYRSWEIRKDKMMRYEVLNSKENY